jgi:hypothetical protein
VALLNGHPDKLALLVKPQCPGHRVPPLLYLYRTSHDVNIYHPLALVNHVMYI